MSDPTKRNQRTRQPEASRKTQGNVRIHFLRDTKPLMLDHTNYQPPHTYSSNYDHSDSNDVSAMDAMLDLLKYAMTHDNNSDVIIACLLSLNNLFLMGSNKRYKIDLIDSGGLSLILTLLNENKKNKIVTENTLTLLSNVSFDNCQFSLYIIDGKQRALKTICKSLSYHYKQSNAIVHSGLTILTNVITNLNKLNKTQTNFVLNFRLTNKNSKLKEKNKRHKHKSKDIKDKHRLNIFEFIVQILSYHVKMINVLNNGCMLLTVMAQSSDTVSNWMVNHDLTNVIINMSLQEPNNGLFQQTCVNCLWQVSKVDANVRKMIQLPSLFYLIVNIVKMFHKTRKKCLRLLKQCIELLTVFCTKYNEISSPSDSYSTKHTAQLSKNKHIIFSGIFEQLERILTHFYQQIRKDRKKSIALKKTKYQQQSSCSSDGDDIKNNNDKSKENKKYRKHIKNIENYYNMVIKEVCNYLEKTICISLDDYDIALWMVNAGVINILSQILSHVDAHYDDELFVNIGNGLTLSIVAVYQQLCKLENNVKATCASEGYLQYISHSSGKPMLRFAKRNVKRMNKVLDCNSISKRNSHCIKQNMNDIIGILFVLIELTKDQKATKYLVDYNACQVLVECFQVALKLVKASRASRSRAATGLDLTGMIDNADDLLENIIRAFTNIIASNQKGMTTLNDSSILRDLDECVKFFPEHQSLISVSKSFKSLYVNFVANNVSQEMQPEKIDPSLSPATKQDINTRIDRYCGNYNDINNNDDINIDSQSNKQRRKLRTRERTGQDTSAPRWKIPLVGSDDDYSFHSKDENKYDNESENENYSGQNNISSNYNYNDQLKLAKANMNAYVVDHDMHIEHSEQASKLSLFQSKTTIAKTPEPSDIITTHGQFGSVTNLWREKMRTFNDETKKDDKAEQEGAVGKDDWIVDNDYKNNVIVSIETPSFIRLFVIRRIIDEYIKNDRLMMQNETSAMYELANVFEDNQCLVAYILIRLQKYGVKNYMKNYYVESEQANIIEDIFNKIILVKFNQEYYQLIENAYEKNIVGSDIDRNFYQNRVFSSADLTCEIFQFLEYGFKFDQDLFQCSLVNSCWLYHAWNTHCVYHVNLSYLFNQTLDNNKCSIKNDAIRAWQRLIHVKSIYLSVFVTDENKDVRPISLVLDKLSMLRRIKKVNINAYGNKSALLLKSLLGKCKERLEYCETRIDTNCSILEKNQLPPLKLPNAQFIGIGDLHFYRIWGNQCRWLKLYNTRIGKKWCDFVIKNCDCSNVTSLELNDVTFDDQLIDSLMLLKQFISKFSNLKQLKLYFCELETIQDNIFAFWQFLKQRLSKNKVVTELTLNIIVPTVNNEISLLNQTMEIRHLTPKKLIVQTLTDGSETHVKKLIEERDGWGLKHVVVDGKFITREVQLLNQLFFRSINVFEVVDSCGDCDYNSLNYVLGSKVFIQKQVFVIMDCKINYYNKNDSFLLVLFKRLCGNICGLIDGKIAVDIKIRFVNVGKKIFNSHLSLYSSYFRCKQFLSMYNQPNCKNNLCLPRSKPYTYFYINKQDKSFILSVTNVNYL